MLPKAPDAELPKDSLIYQLIDIKASIILIDMVSRNEVAFKLMPDSIESLTKYHRDIHCVNLANTYTDSQLEVEKLQEEFVQAIHKFVYRTHVSALEGLEPDGSGELLCEESGEVKTNILSLLLKAPPQKIPLPPPPPQKILPRSHPVPREVVLGSSVEALLDSSTSQLRGRAFDLSYPVPRELVLSSYTVEALPNSSTSQLCGRALDLGYNYGLFSG
jgi:hypothetical protein